MGGLGQLQQGCCLMREYRSVSASRPRADLVVGAMEDVAVVRDLTVFDAGEAWVRTDLLDASGTPLMRRDRMDPIGFIYPKDR